MRHFSDIKLNSFPRFSNIKLYNFLFMCNKLNSIKSIYGLIKNYVQTHTCILKHMIHNPFSMI